MIAVVTSAVVLAVVAAVCFAVAAVVQHRFVGVVAENGPADPVLSRTGFQRLIRQRGWLIGFGIGAVGAVLHVAALALAPLSVVQPVGVLAVPIAVLLTALMTARWPPRVVWTGAGVTVVGIAVFVTLAAGTTATKPVPAQALFVASVAAAAVAAVPAAAALLTRGWVRCVACAISGAVLFGMASAFVRAVSLRIGSGTPAWELEVVATMVAVTAALAAGVVLVQHGYAAGPPEVVVACLTVVDPVVAVALGVALLGEEAETAPAAWLIMVAAAALAAAGVIAVARHHPDAVARSAAHGHTVDHPRAATSP